MVDRDTLTALKLLAIDTTTEACSAAVMSGGVVHSQWELTPRRHGERILSLIEHVLAEGGLAPAQLDAVVTTQGPGAFTGVRVGISVAQALAFGLDLPVVPVSSLAALAAGYRGEAPATALAAIDARMGEVYWGVYRIRDRDDVELLGVETASAPLAVPAPPHGGPYVGIGSGWKVHGTVLAQRFGLEQARIEASALPHAREVVRLGARAFQAGAAVSPEFALPVYLRDWAAQR